MKYLFFWTFILIQFLAFGSQASEVSYCTKVGRWAESMTFVHLKNKNLITPDEIDYDKTTISLINEVKEGDDLYTQVHLVTYTKKTGEKIRAISINKASSVECSMSSVDVYLDIKALDKKEK